LLILASMNPDILGVNELQDAVRDRSNLVLFFDYPSVEKETELVNKLTGLNMDIAERFTSVINECRQLKTRDRQITQAPSTRGLLDWINYAPVLGTEIAFDLAVVNRYGTSEDERNALKMIARGKHIANLLVTGDSFKR
jgi:MoxR-like ATPase